MDHYTRLIEQDLLPVTQNLTVGFAATFVREADADRLPEHVAKAALIALAATAEALRKKFDLDIEAWAQANRIAQSATSLTNTAELLPATKQRMAGLKARA